MSQKTVVIIGGPTAVGKTSVAIAIAQHLSTQIISADSRQCFREMRIGVARPSEEELAAVPHHFIATHSIQEKVTAATFEQYALEKAATIFQQHNVLVMTGGTGLYLKAFCEGFDAIPEVPEAIQADVRSAYAQKGLPWLQEEVKKSDPNFFAVGENKNPQRLMRALEVLKATGRSILYFRKGTKAERDFKVIKIALELPKERLHQNINHRADAMMGQGLLEEVRSLMPYQHLNALQTVGYRELFSYFNDECALPDAIEAIKRNTRRYAKRELTWFRKDGQYTWFAPASLVEIKHFLEDELAPS